MSTHTNEAQTLPLTLGQQFQLARERTGHDQAELGRLFGVNRTTISRWERNKAVPPFTAVARLSEMSGWPLDLFARAETPSDDGPNNGPGQGIPALSWRDEHAGQVLAFPVVEADLPIAV